MPRWSPPNPLIYLGAFLRPSLLRPDIRVPTIGHVDWKALRQQGFNAVVIDKDNCLTIPDRDELYPPLQSAWSNILTTFPPGRVLVVSNSAGTAKKDPSGVAAESVSLSLRAPVLLHDRPKPGCASDILAYFSTNPHTRSSFLQPSTLRARIAAKHRQALTEEEADVRELVARCQDLVDAPVMHGEGQGVERNNGGKTADSAVTVKDAFSRSFISEAKSAEATSSLIPSSPSPSALASSPSPSSPISSPTSQSPNTSTSHTSPTRIVVIGDRLFTDTLLASRLRHLLPSTPPHPSSPQSSSLPRDSVISIHTDRLPQPNDVRILRRLESFLTRDRLRQSNTDWGRYALIDPSVELREAEENTRDWRRFIPFRQTYLAAPVLKWDPRSWRPVTVVVAAGRGVKWGAIKLIRGIRTGGGWAWSRGRDWYTRGRVGEGGEVGKAVKE